MRLTLGALAVGGAIAIGAFALRRQPEPPAHPPAPLERQRTTDEILAERDRLDRTVWAQEVEAQRYEEPFIALWDGMRGRLDDQHVLLADFPVGALAIRSFGPEEAHRWSLITATMNGETSTLGQTEWRALIARLAAEGYVLEQSEWHHAAFEHPANGPARSTMTCKLFIRRGDQRLVIAGPLSVIWSGALDERGRPTPATIDATGLTLTAREGSTAFTEAWTFRPEEIGAPQAAIDPVLLADLDGDGRDEVVLPAVNLVQWNRSRPGAIAFAPAKLCERPSWTISGPGPTVSAAILADLTGDGIVDLVVVGPRLPPQLLIGTAGGGFAADPTPLTGLPADAFVEPMVVTAGDVDGDGRLDLWIGQYRKPFVDGNLPTPYWDARDGYPSFLLINQGGGRFRDATAAWGLAEKRNRRTYSASFIDLDQDGRLDLLTVNDFAGLDLWRNVGGRFVAADDLADQRAAFGMSHAIADFDGDGVLDLFVAGMGSTTARRLERMGLGRAEFPQHQAMRMPMGYGNRLLLGGADHRFRQAAFNDQVARTGWSWGCAAADFGNDGRLDLYVANGHLSRGTAKDYCSRYWTQDIYTAGRPGDDELARAFRAEMDRTAGMSWNGYEHKALLLNEGGSFRDVAYAVGLGFEWDGRAVVADDLDGDGAVDLLIEELRTPRDGTVPSRSVLHAYRNGLAAGNHWLDVRLAESPGRSPQGARITVTAGGRTIPFAIVSGDSYRTQRPPLAHIGLGGTTRVSSVTVTWPDGHTITVANPPIDRELVVRP